MAVGVLVVGLAASTAFVVELVQLVVGLCERVMVVGWILKRLGMSGWEAVRSGGVIGVPVGHITQISSVVSSKREVKRPGQTVVHLLTVTHLASLPHHASPLALSNVILQPPCPRRTYNNTK